MKEWRPKIKASSVSIQRDGKMFAINCRTNKEARAVEKSVISAMIRERK